ncbi:MAG TPA: LysE family translocator [Aeromonadales bacterium]|nr:LysE family translocator [Aeromonadales bacterium]
MDTASYLLFLMMTMVVVFAPGPAAITIASQAAGNGGKKAISGVFGVAVANFLYFMLSATGITSLILASANLFSLIKWLGVGYLIYLGSSALFSQAGAIKLNSEGPGKNGTNLFFQGLLVELSNPKALLYFSALLPQFIDPQRDILTQIVIMSLTCFTIDIISYSTYAYLGHIIARGSVKKWMINVINKTVGMALLFAGLKMAFVEAEQ